MLFRSDSRLMRRRGVEVGTWSFSDAKGWTVREVPRTMSRSAEARSWVSPKSDGSANRSAMQTYGHTRKEALGEAFSKENNLGLHLHKAAVSAAVGGSEEARRTSAPGTPLHLGSSQRTIFPRSIWGLIASLVYWRLHSRHSASAKEPVRIGRSDRQLAGHDTRSRYAPCASITDSSSSPAIRSSVSMFWVNLPFGQSLSQPSPPSRRNAERQDACEKVLTLPSRSSCP